MELRGGRAVEIELVDGHPLARSGSAEARELLLQPLP
jgi:hypothetical protein